MSGTQEISFAPLRQAAAMANAQRGLACWSRAWTQIAHGMMSAGMAQMDIVRSMYATAPDDWDLLSHPGTPQEAAHRCLLSTQAKFGAAVKGYRRAHDELAASFFAAAETLADGLESEPAPAADAAASNARGAAVKPPVARQ